MAQLPAMSLAAVPGRRQKIIEIAQEAERRGFPGIYGPSLGDSLSLCTAIAMVTSEIKLGTSITPIYTRNVTDFASTVAFIHEISNGRFSFGVGVSHEPAMSRLGIKQGKPLADMRQFVEDLRAAPRVGDLPPIVLATLRNKMIALAEEIAEGVREVVEREPRDVEVELRGPEGANQRRVFHRQYDSHLYQRRQGRGHGRESENINQLCIPAELS